MMPVCLVFGENDYLFSPIDAAAKLMQSVPHSEISILPDTGHIIVGQTKKIIAFFDNINKCSP
jgi:pimeloyl-ACP methyl ester carboxylesterase